MTDAQWVSMSEASKEVGVSVSKLSRLAREGRIKTERDPYDERVTLVNLTELRIKYPGKRRK